MNYTDMVNNEFKVNLQKTENHFYELVMEL